VFEIEVNRSCGHKEKFQVENFSVESGKNFKKAVEGLIAAEEEKLCGACQAAIPETKVDESAGTKTVLVLIFGLIYLSLLSQCGKIIDDFCR
jgi:hypothetical protein